MLYFFLAFLKYIDTKLWMQNVPNTLILHIQEHIAKIILYLTFITLSYHNPHITIIRFLVYSLQPFICILIQNHACKMLPIYLYCILGTHHKKSLASFFDRLLVYFLLAVIPYYWYKTMNAKCSQYIYIIY